MISANDALKPPVAQKALGVPAIARIVSPLVVKVLSEAQNNDVGEKLLNASHKAAERLVGHQFGAYSIENLDLARGARSSNFGWSLKGSQKRIISAILNLRT